MHSEVCPLLFRRISEGAQVFLAEESVHSLLLPLKIRVLFWHLCSQRIRKSILQSFCQSQWSAWFRRTVPDDRIVLCAHKSTDDALTLEIHIVRFAQCVRPNNEPKQTEKKEKWIIESMG